MALMRVSAQSTFFQCQTHARAVSLNLRKFAWNFHRYSHAKRHRLRGEAVNNVTCINYMNNAKQFSRNNYPLFNFADPSNPLNARRSADRLCRVFSYLFMAVVWRVHAAIKNTRNSGKNAHNRTHTRWLFTQAAFHELVMSDACRRDLSTIPLINCKAPPTHNIQIRAQHIERNLAALITALINIMMNHSLFCMIKRHKHHIQPPQSTWHLWFDTVAVKAEFASVFERNYGPWKAETVKITAVFAEPNLAVDCAFALSFVRHIFQQICRRGPLLRPESGPLSS